MKDRATYRQNIAAAGKLSLAVLAAAMGALTAEAAPPGGYTFSVVATLGDPAPGGGRHINDLEPGDINSRGDVAFASDLQDDNGTFLERACTPGTTGLPARSPVPATRSRAR